MKTIRWSLPFEMSRLSGTGVLFICLAALGGPARFRALPCVGGTGEVASHSANIALFHPPPPGLNLRNDHLTSPTTIYMVTEQAVHITSHIVFIDLPGPCVDVHGAPCVWDQNHPPPGGMIPAGVSVTSHIIHHDTIDGVLSDAGATITFMSPILGVILNRTLLNNSDAELAHPQVVYPTAANGRGWEIGGPFGWVGISPDRRTLTVQGRVVTSLDEMRVIVQAPCTSADLNGDGLVNSSDLATLLGSWGPCPTPPAPCASDLDGNGSVNASDLAALLGSWGPVL